jgi:shikimate kinase
VDGIDMNKLQIKNIFLIGAAGVGKTTVGRQLAKALRFTFYDSDKELEARTGVRLSWVVDIEGESGLRQREEKIVAELSALPNIVLAIGSDAILLPQNQALLKARGTIIYLQASPTQQSVDTPGAADRPLSGVAEADLTAQQLFTQRENLYCAAADLIFPTDELSIREIVAKVLEKLLS